MKFKAIIIGVRDFVSGKGRPLRQIFCNGVPNLAGLSGQTAFMVWQFDGDDYFSVPVKDLLEVECTCMDVNGKTVILQVDKVDSK